jgi:hypothetical protein
MKKLITLLLILFAFTASAQSNVVKFDTTAINYGVIKAGSDGKRTFEFTNVSREPIAILTVTVYCGCTVPNWTNELILPGKKGTITIEYDTNRIGRFGKEVKVKTTGSEEETRLIIWGTVIENESTR